MTANRTLIGHKTVNDQHLSTKRFRSITISLVVLSAGRHYKHGVAVSFLKVSTP
jgi:hypothetical protein